MSLQLYNHGEGGTGLIAVCDVCKKRVKAEDANVCWVPDVFRKGESYPYRIACKDSCTRRLDAAEGAKQWTQDLDVAIAFLANNTGIKFSRLDRKMRMLWQAGMIGESEMP